MSDMQSTKPTDSSSVEDDLFYWTDRLCSFKKGDDLFLIKEASDGFDESLKDLKMPDELDLICRKEVIYTLIDLVGKTQATELTKYWKIY
jgi:hypothetical protein